MKSITKSGLVPTLNKSPRADKITAGLQELDLIKKKMTIVARRCDESTGRRKALLTSHLECLQEEFDAAS